MAHVEEADLGAAVLVPLEILQQPASGDEAGPGELAPKPKSVARDTAAVAIAVGGGEQRSSLKRADLEVMLLGIHVGHELIEERAHLGRREARYVDHRACVFEVSVSGEQLQRDVFVHRQVLLKTGAERRAPRAIASSAP